MSTEFFISFAIVMMMLSLVSERVSNLIKLYFQNKEIYIPFLVTKKGTKISDYNFWKDLKFFIKVKIVILAYKQPTEMAEKEREYRLMIINILTGITIACLSNANFFEIVRQISHLKKETSLNIQGILFNGFSVEIIFGAIYFLFFIWSVSLILFGRLQELDDNNKSKYKYPFLFWLGFTIVMLLIIKIIDPWCNSKNHFDFISIVRHTVGFTITGLFLSLGSKFWHDLLDILFKFKNTQQVLSDPKTYTNYDNADALMNFANTPQYKIVESLYEKYKDKIAVVPGVVSHGLHIIFDEKTSLFKKIIEVEYKDATSQNELDILKFNGSIELNFNTFYLKDYFRYKFTSKLSVLSGAITDVNPVCYANNVQTPDNMGTFNILKDGSSFYAVSNLHVFADKSELKAYNANNNTTFINKAVDFKIGTDTFRLSFDTKKLKFGTFYDQGMDLCYAKINDQAMVTAYNNYIMPQKITNFSKDKMSMFGASSKYMKLEMLNSFETTECLVEYHGFDKKMKLIKVPQTSDNYVKLGDSGSFLYYKQVEGQKETLFKGVIVATSDNYAYIFRYLN